jgi:hypothetical protein
MDGCTFVAVDWEAWREACDATAAGDTIIIPAGSDVIPSDGTNLPVRGVIVRATPPDPDEAARRGPGARRWWYGRWVAGEAGMPARYR